MFVKNRIKSFCVIMTLLVAITLFMFCATGAGENEKEEQVYLPVIMYHSLLSDTKLQNAYTISPSVFENDLKYFTQNGYTTITVNDIINYVYADKALPRKCVVLTFDDGYYNNYYYAYPLLKKYKCRAVISPIVAMTEKYTNSGNIATTYGHISVDNIKEMVSSGCVEIQNHSYNMHSLSPRRGAAQKKGESTADYTKFITDDITKAQNYLTQNAGVTPNCFIYPFGEESTSTLDTVKKLGFVCTMTCTEKPNFISQNPESLYELGRYLRKSNESTKSLMQRIESDIKQP